MSGRSDYGIQSQIHVGDDVTGQDNLHVVAGITDGVGTRPEEVENRVEEHQGDDGEGNTDNQVQGDDIAQYRLCCAIVPLSQLHGDKGRGTHTYHGPKGCSQVHEREGNGQTRNSQRTYTMSDEDTVHHII